MEKIIVTTPDELRSLIEEIFTRSCKKVENLEKSSAEHMTLEDAMIFLKGNGFPTSKAKLYRLTSKNEIPHRKYGNKLVFSRKQLMDWALKNAPNMTDHTEDIVSFITHNKSRGRVDVSTSEIRRQHKRK